MSQTQPSTPVTDAVSTASSPVDLQTRSAEDEIAELNSASLARMAEAVNSTPPQTLVDFYGREGARYVRALRKIRPTEPVVNLYAADDSKYVSIRGPPSISRVLNPPLDRVELDRIITKINKRCYEETDNRKLAYKYRQVTTDYLMSRASVGESISDCNNVFKVDENVVAKRVPLNIWMLEEAANVQLITKMTSIPVPEIIRVHTIRREIYIFMSLLPGTTLESQWQMMTTEDKENIAIQLKVFMTELRSVPPPALCWFGSLDTHICIDSRAWSRLNVGDNRLILTEAEFNEFIQTDFDTGFPGGYYDMLFSMLRDDHKIVLTHGDLHPRNILIKDMVITGIIDWEFTGWYPEYWEYIKALKSVQDVVDWWKYLPQIVGSYHAEWALDRVIERVMIMRQTSSKTR
jgi:aminoglycoside phosphotransferase